MARCVAMSEEVGVLMGFAPLTAGAVLAVTGSIFLSALAALSVLVLTLALLVGGGSS